MRYLTRRRCLHTITILVCACMIAFLFSILVKGSKRVRGEDGDQLSATLDNISISLVPVAEGFNAPVQLTHAGDGSGRMFVVEQLGRIMVIKDGVVLPQAYLDIRSLVNYSGEKGLLGLAFHPQYQSNGYFYINYIRDSDRATVIERYQAVPARSNTVDPNSAFTILVVPQPYSNHNGGQLLFSPVDGFLYIGMGDGGSGGDPLDSGQDINTPLGAMLRIDVDGAVPYAVPNDNPYVNKPGLDEIWAIGLRNPWRFSFDRLTGDIYIGDVGQNAYEEVDFQAAMTPGGTNFGWRCMEGFHTYNFTGDCPSLVLTDPIAEYSHAEGRSVTGGFVYRGRNYPALTGRYFYADYVTGKIWSVQKISSNPLTWTQPELVFESGLNISSFGEDEEGELYITAISQQSVYQIVDANGPTPNLEGSAKRSSSVSADPNEFVTYTIILENSGGSTTVPVFITDTIPLGLSYSPGTFQASSGTTDDTALPDLFWQGTIANASNVTLTYQVGVTGAVTGSLINQAQVTASVIQPFTLTSALFVPRSPVTSTLNDFILPGTQPGSLHLPIQPSIDCDICHSSPIYDSWRGSMMSQAGRDPLFWAAVAVANVDAAEAGELCLRCHLTTGWFAGRSHPADGSSFTYNDISNGVACNMCHRMVDPLQSISDETSALDISIRSVLTMPVPSDYVGTATLIIDPEDNRRGPFSFNPDLPYHTAYQSDFLNQKSDAVTRSRLCGSCHNVDNPVLQWDAVRGQYWPNDMDTPPGTFGAAALFPVERTYDEWLFSQYAREGVYAPEFAGDKTDGIVQACQDCHMTRQSDYAADSAFSPVLRDCGVIGCLPVHNMVGGNTWIPLLLRESTWRLNAVVDSPYLQDTEKDAEAMLRKAATLTVTLATSDTMKIATVRVTNQTGHKLPTGYPEGRQMWLHLQAYNGSDQVIYESGVYDVSTGQLDRDADIKIYEVKQGLSPELATLLNQPAGESFHFVLNNSVIKDNRIPPRGVLQSDYEIAGLKPVQAVYADGQYWDESTYVLPESTTRVMVTLYYQTASREYIDFLTRLGGVNGLALGDLWEGSKSPPVIMAKTWAPSYVFYLPVMMRSN